MERKIGETFEYEGEKLKVVNAGTACDGCYFKGKSCDNRNYDITGICGWTRKDNQSVRFIKVTEEQQDEQPQQKTKEPKERKIGETFEYEGKKLKVVETEGSTCYNCYFEDRDCDCDTRKVLGACLSETRTDNKQVIFIEVKDEPEEQPQEAEQPQKLNLCEILKHCPQGEPFWSQLFRDVKLYCTDQEAKKVVVTAGNVNWSINADGTITISGVTSPEIMLYPSREQRDWAKAYDEAIERAKNLYGNGITEEIFSELKEDDAERIKKNCIHFLELQKQHHAATFEIEECIDWLEKQGKNSTDKIEPRFKVGDWVVFITSGSVYQVEKKENYEYTLRYILGGSLCLPFSNEELIRKWTIQDAKDGDVLACNEEILLFKSYSVQERISSYCWYNGQTNNFHSKEVIDTLLTKRNKICPATKEQRDLLFQKIKEAGYKWNAETKTLEKLIKPKFKVGDIQERFENDIAMLKQIAEDYPCKTIENIIQQMEARKKEYINSVQNIRNNDL